MGDERIMMPATSPVQKMDRIKKERESYERNNILFVEYSFTTEENGSKITRPGIIAPLYLAETTLKDGRAFLKEGQLEPTKRIKAELQAALKQWKIKYPTNDEGANHLKSWIRSLQYRIKELTELYDGQPLLWPADVFRNSYYTEEIVKSFNLIPDTEISVTEEYINRLNTREAQYILESIHRYLDEYFDTTPRPIDRPRGRTLPKVYLTSGDLLDQRYIIEDTFSNFCKRSGVNDSRLRKNIAKTLFGKERPLLEIPFIQAKDQKKGGRPFRVIEFITTPYREGIESASGLSSYTRVKIGINALVYGFIDENYKDFRERKLKAGSLPEGTSIFPYPRGVTRAVDDAVDLAINIGALRRKSHMQKYRSDLIAAVHYLHDQWKTGSKNRQGHKIVTWGELANAGFLAHNKPASRHFRRSEDMQTLSDALNSCAKLPDSLLPECFYDKDSNPLEIYLYDPN